MFLYAGSGDFFGRSLEQLHNDVEQRNCIEELHRSRLIGHRFEAFSESEAVQVFPIHLNHQTGEIARLFRRTVRTLPGLSSDFWICIYVFTWSFFSYVFHLNGFIWIEHMPLMDALLLMNAQKNQKRFMKCHRFACHGFRQAARFVADDF